MRPTEMAGRRVGQLTVLERAGSSAQRQALWLCICSCGNKTTVPGFRLRDGTTGSCGCARVPHGHTRDHKPSPTYRSWTAMWGRCTQPTVNGYENYGGRGIKVCARWEGFERFLADMGERPPGTTLDRIDENGNYEPGNCRWATAVEQQNNKRSNHTLTVNGETLTVSQWARRTGIGKTTLHERLRRGWPAERVVAS